MTRRPRSGPARSKAAKGRVPEPQAEARAPLLRAETRRALLHLAALGVCGYASLALASWHPGDPGFNHRSSWAEVSNWCGRWGAWVSDAMYQGLGWSAWMIVPLAAWVAVRLSGRRAGGLPALLLGAAATAALAVQLGLAFGLGDGAFPPGGLLGDLLVRWLLEHVGTAGAWVMVLLAELTLATVALRIDWAILADRGVRAVEEVAPQVGAASLATARRAGAGLVTAASLGARATVTLADRARQAHAERQERVRHRRELEQAREGEALEWTGPEIDVDPDALRPEPAVHVVADDTQVEFDAVARMDGGARHTEVTRRELVEVEYEPTTFEDEGAEPAGSVLPWRRSRRTQAAEAQPTGSRPTPPRSAAQGGGGAAQRAAPPAGAHPPTAPRTSTRVGAAEPPQHPVTAAGRHAPTAWVEVEEVATGPADDERSSVADLKALLDQAEARAFEEERLVDGPAAAAPGPRPLPRAIPAPAQRPQGSLFGVAIEPGDLASGGDDADDLIVRVERSVEPFELPTLGLLDRHERDVASFDEEELKELAATLEAKLADFGIQGEVAAIRPGPVITIFEYVPAPGVKVASIARLGDDLAMALKALRVRIVAPIPGKGAVGIEIPNHHRQMVWLRDLLASPDFREVDHQLPMALGKSVEGRPVVVDLAKMPHLLVGGTTGSGKSVGVNAMLLSMLYKLRPDELKLILIDPKMLEFELYGDIPHLLHPVVTEPKLAAAALKWACKEMDDRYRILARWGTRNIRSYNEKVARELEEWSPAKARRYAPRGWPADQEPPPPAPMPFIVIVIDELADLMMVAAKEVEECIVRLAQKARACGIHLIVATQRPSVDVITGLIKANMPARIAFQVRSKTDGRTILDQNGAEALLGKGDMLYLPPGVSALARLHGPFVADEEAQRVTDHLRGQAEPEYIDGICEEESEVDLLDDGELDEVYDLAIQVVRDAGRASTSMIQRRLKIGYNRAARIIEKMERDGIVGPADGARPREVLGAG